MESITLQTPGAEIRGQRYQLRHDAVVPMKGSIETGHLRYARQALEDGVDRREVEGLVQRRQRRQLPEFPHDLRGHAGRAGELLTAVHDDLLTIDDLVDRMSTNPRRLFGIADDDTTYIEVDTEATWEISGADGLSRAGWTPFEGRRVTGRTERVVLRGQEVFANGHITAPAGYGRDIMKEEQ